MTMEDLVLLWQVSPAAVWKLIASVVLLVLTMAVGVPLMVHAWMSEKEEDECLE